jgi:hypothetical protein
MRTVGCTARLLDAVQGRSERLYAGWLAEQGVEVTVAMEHAALDPFWGYMDRLRAAAHATPVGRRARGSRRVRHGRYRWHQGPYCPWGNWKQLSHRFCGVDQLH